MLSKIRVLNKGDRVINVTKDFVAVERKNHEVDIIPIVVDEAGIRIASDRIVTITYGDNTVETTTDDGVIITNF